MASPPRTPGALVHRDIKPGNILLSPDGRVQVADFGIAHVAARSPVTSTGITLGSVLYFSPEQARGDTASPASDVYSLGLVMYELLTGQRPFSGDSPAAVAVARLSGGVPSPMAVRPETPPALDAIVRWCLAVDPAVRPTAAELSQALTRFVADPSGASALAAAGLAAATPAAATSAAAATPIPALGDPSEGQVPGHGGSGPLAWAAAGLGLLVIIASGILLFILFSGIEDSPPPPARAPRPAWPSCGRPTWSVGPRETPPAWPSGAASSWRRHTWSRRPTWDGSSSSCPLPGMRVPAGTSIQVTVGTEVETVVVPDVHGIREANAMAQLQAAGLAAGPRSSTEDLLPEGYVVSTDPTGRRVPGTRLGRRLRRLDVARGTGATLEPAGHARSGRDAPARASVKSNASSDLILVGDFPCLRLAEARGHIDDAGLRVGVLIGRDRSPRRPNDWLVHDQLPKAGEMVAIGSNVDLVLEDEQQACP